MKVHVLVQALSTFRDKGQMPETEYVYVDKSLNVDHPDRWYTYRGHYQLEPVPMFITEKLQKTITHVVLLETDDIRNPKKKKTVCPAPDKLNPHREWTGTPAKWYKEWLTCKFGKELVIKDIPIDEHKPVEALEEVSKYLRDLYDQVDPAEEDAWSLWFDTHGGFRDITLVLMSAARMFAVDEKRPITTDGVYSIYYTYNDGNPKGEIVNQTPFYFTESSSALKSFLNYGQYLSNVFAPYKGSLPYAFISYRHNDEFLTCVRTIFSKFEEHKIRYWFDRGIHQGEKWAETLRKRNEDAKIFIALICNDYFNSAECWKELIRSIALEKVRHHDRKTVFILLEAIKSWPCRPEVDEFCPEDYIMELNEQLHTDLTMKDVEEFLKKASTVQWLQWHRFMPSADNHEIAPSNLDDPEIATAFMQWRNDMDTLDDRGISKHVEPPSEELAAVACLPDC